MLTKLNLAPKQTATPTWQSLDRPQQQSLLAQLSQLIQQQIVAQPTPLADRPMTTLRPEVMHEPPS